MADIQYYGTGRRKTASARVYLRPGNGQIMVNRKAFETYFPNETLRMIIHQTGPRTGRVFFSSVIVMDGRVFGGCA